MSAHDLKLLFFTCLPTYDRYDVLYSFFFSTCSMRAFEIEWNCDCVPFQRKNIEKSLNVDLKLYSCATTFQEILCWAWFIRLSQLFFVFFCQQHKQLNDHKAQIDNDKTSERAWKTFISNTNILKCFWLNFAVDVASDRSTECNQTGAKSTSCTIAITTAQLSAAPSKQICAHECAMKIHIVHVVLIVIGFAESINQVF